VETILREKEGMRKERARGRIGWVIRRA